MFAFVRSFEEGGTYMTLGPAYVTLPDGRRVKSVARSLRQRAAIKMAGHVAEDLFHGRDVRNADALPRAEGVTAFDREHCRCDNPALPFFAAALAYLDGDADRAERWLAEMFETVDHDDGGHVHAPRPRGPRGSNAAGYLRWTQLGEEEAD